MCGDAGSGVDASGHALDVLLDMGGFVKKERCFCSFRHYFHDVVISFVSCSFALLLLVSLFRVDCHVLGRGGRS